jgi:hypothetical protein
MSSTFQTTAPSASVVDDATYDLLQALTSKLEAIEAYEQYVLDGNESIFGELLEDERRHATRLVDALRERLAKR